MTLLPAAPFEPPYHACIFVDSPTRGQNGFAARAEEMIKLAQAQPGFLGLESVRDADGSGILVSYWRDEQSVTAWRQHAADTAARGHGANRPWYQAFTVHVVKVTRSYTFPQPTKRKNPSFPDRYALVRTLDEIHRLPSREN